MFHQGIIFEYNKNEKDCWICRNEEWNRCIVANDTFVEEFTGKAFNQVEVLVKLKNKFH